MRNKLQFALALLMLIVGGGIYLEMQDENKSNLQMEELRIIHQKLLKNSPFKNTKELTKKERLITGLPPNKYLEREWELTMNPYLGRPTPENLTKIQNFRNYVNKYREGGVNSLLKTNHKSRDSLLSESEQAIVADELDREIYSLPPGNRF